MYIRQNQNVILQQFNEKVNRISHTNLLENDDNDGMHDEINMQQQSLIYQQKSQLKQKIKNEIIPIFTNYFWMNGGTDAVNQLFNHPNKMIPLDSLLLIIRIIGIGSKFMKDKPLIPLIDQLCNYVITRMSLLTEREIKEYDPMLIKRIREILQNIVKSHPEIEASDSYLKRIDEMDLNLALKLLSSQYLNKKIQGLNDISEIISEIKQNDSFLNGNNNDDIGYRNNSEYYSDQLNDRRYNPKEFTEWVIQNKIIDHLLGDSMHVEIVRRCHEIIRFMCFCKQFPVELIDTIWNSCGSDKHEAIVSAIFEMIISITDQLSKEALLKFHEKINSIPLNEINEQTLMLIRGFSQKAIDRLIPTFKLNYQSQDQQGSDTEELEEGQEEIFEEHKENHVENRNKLQRDNSESKHEKNFFCLDLLLKLINEDNNQGLSYLVVDTSLQIAKDILCLQQGQIIAKKYVNVFLDQITSGKSSYQAYYLIYALIDNQYSPDILMSLQRKGVNLPEIIVDDICSYLASIPDSFNKLQSGTVENIKNSPNQSQAYRSTVFKGKYSHEHNIHVRFQLLEIILTKTFKDNKRIFCLSSQDFDKLWNQFINIPNHICESQIFLNWIHSKTMQKQNQNYMNHIDISSLFTVDLMKHIFFNIFCNSAMMKYSTFTPELFNIFFFLFKKINLKARNIEHISNLNKFKVQNEDLAGMKTMWDIFGEAENKLVVTNCCDQLSEIYLNHEKNWEPQFRDHYMKQLTEKCMQFLQEGYNKQSSQLIERAVQLLILFFSKIEGVSYRKQFEMQQNQYSQQYLNQTTFTFILQNQNENIKKDIKVNQNIPFGMLRRKIAAEFKIPTTSFRLFCKTHKQFIEPFQDEEIIHSARNIYYVQLIEGADMENTFHPKNFITQNNEYFDLLFSLLSLNFPTDDCNNNLWELILQLPTNEHVKQSIIKMQEPWEEILKGSFHKKLYCLNIMDELLQKSNQNNQWLQRFIQSNGYKYLYEYLSQLDMNIIQNALSKKFIRRLLKMISYLFEVKLKGEHIFQDAPERGREVLNNCFKKMIECIYRICEYCLLREEKDLENCSQEKLNYNHQFLHYQRMLNQNQNNNQQEPRKPEFYNTEIEIVSNCFSILNQDHIERISDLFCHPLMERIIKKGLAQIDNTYLQNMLCSYLNYMYQNCQNKAVTLKHLLPTLLQTILPDLVRYSKVNGVLIQQNNLMIPENAPIETYRAEQTRFFFAFTQQIINLTKDNQEIAQEFDFVTTAMNIAEMIIARPILEISQNNKDDILIGLINLLKEIVQLHPTLNISLPKKYNIIKQLLDFSFEFPQISKKSDSIFSSNSALVRGPKIKSSETRRLSFDLLKQISFNVPENIYQLVQYLKPLILSGDWRTKNYKDWDIVPKKNEKSSTGYVGIKNLGCICYMNSLLQQLFMIPSFRQTILRCKDPQYESTPQEDNILYQLKCMFTSLCYSEKEAYNPKAFCHAFKDYDGNPTNVFEQMDIDEFFNSLMDKLENQMKDTKHADAIKKHFGGVFSNEIISKGCQHYSEREEAYLSISLQVKNKKDIKQSLEALTQGEMLEGDNSYHCEKCDKKVVALKRTCLKKLPNHLILVLKRFEFNYDNMQKVKINQLCSFPDEIDFQEFSQQGLRKAEQAQNKQQKQQHGNDVEYPENYFKYRLYGIGIHMGIADSGHYYSYIRDRETSNGEEKWMEFNDNVVKFFDPKDIPDEAFGGEEKWRQFYMMESMNMMNAFRQKIRNAYLLFYDRIEKFDEDQFQQTNTKSKEKDESSDQNVQILEFDDEQEDLAKDEEKKKMKMVAEEDEELGQGQEEEMPQGGPEGADAISGEHKNKDSKDNQPKIEIEDTEEYEEKYCGEFKQELLKQNMSFHLHKILFSQEFSQFMYNLMNLYNQNLLGENKQPIDFPFELNPNNLSKEFYDLSFIKFCLTYFFTTAIRQRVRSDNQSSLESFYFLINFQLIKNTPAVQWLIKCFTDPRLIKEIVMSPSTDAKELVITILDQCCRILYALERAHIHEIEEETELPKTMVGQFINSLLYCFSSAENYQEYFQLFYRLILIDDDIGQYLVNRMFIGRAMEFLFSNESKGKKKTNMQFGNNNTMDFPKTPMDISEVPMMGLPAQEKQKKSYESFYKKDRSGFADSCSVTYLFKVLEYLILRSQLPSNNPAKINSKINYNLSKDEIYQLYRDQESVFSFVQKSKDKLAVKSINNILAYLAYEDGLVSEYICGVTSQIVQEQQCQEFSRSFSLLKKIFHIQDSMQQKRIEIALQKMYVSIESNSKYQKETDICQQYLIKLAAHNPLVAQALHKNQQHLAQHIKNIQDYRPNRKEADENQQKKERMDLQYYDIKIPFNVNQLSNLKNWKLKQFEKLKVGDFSFEQPRFDTDDVLPEQEIQKGKYYDFFDDKENKWKHLRCYEINMKKRIAYFFEIVVELMHVNILEEKQAHEKNNQLFNCILPLSTYKLFPFKSISDTYSIQLQPDEDENDEDGRKHDDNDDKKTEEENNSPLNNQYYPYNENQQDNHDHNNPNMFNNNDESDMEHMDGQQDPNQQYSEEEGDMGDDHDQEEEEESDEEEEEEEEDNEGEDQNTTSYQQNRQY